MEIFWEMFGIITLYGCGAGFTLPFIIRLNEKGTLSYGSSFMAFIFWPIFIPISVAFLLGDLICKSWEQL